MKRKIAAGIAAVALAVGGLVWASPALADDEVPVTGEAVVQEAVVTEGEVIVEEPVAAQAPVVVEEAKEAVTVEEPTLVVESRSEPQSSPTSTNPPHEVHKVVVCKYVGKPGVDERLQGGNNPITPDDSTLDWFDGTFPAYFTDGQVKSVAVRYMYDGEKPSDPTLADCPAPDGPDPKSGVDTEQRSACVLPLDGTAIVTTYERKWTQEYILVDDEYVLGEKVYGDWMPAKGLPQTVWDEDCEPGVVPVPAQFDADPVSPTCDEDGALPTLGLFENVTVVWDREFDGPGVYTLSATTHEGYEFPDGTTYKEREFVVLGAIGYQSEDPEADCYEQDITPVTLGQPVFVDACGTDEDSASLPEDAEGVIYAWLSEDPEDFGFYAEVQPGYAVLGDPGPGWEFAEQGDGYEYWVNYWEPVFTDEPCPVDTPTPKPPTPATLAVTGGGDVAPILPISGAVTLLLGIGAALYGTLRRSRA